MAHSALTDEVPHQRAFQSQSPTGQQGKGGILAKTSDPRRGVEKHHGLLGRRAGRVGGNLPRQTQHAPVVLPFQDAGEQVDFWHMRLFDYFALIFIILADKISLGEALDGDQEAFALALMTAPDFRDHRPAVIAQHAEETRPIN